MGRTWPVAFPTSATTWISHVTISYFQMSDCWCPISKIRIEVVENNHSTNRPPPLNRLANQEAPYVIVYHPRKIFPRVSFSFSKYYSKTTRELCQDEKLQQKKLMKGKCWNRLVSDKPIFSKKSNFQYFKKVQRSQNRIWKIKTQWVMG